MNAPQIEALVNRLVEGTDLFLVEVKVSPTNEVEVVIDSDSSVTIDRCAEISRAIEAEFDRDTEDFQLSVMSAGIGQPLRLLRQYRKAVGQPVEVVMKDGMKYTGILEAADEEALVLVWEERQLLEGKKRRQLVPVRKQLLLQEMKFAKRELAFK